MKRYLMFAYSWYYPGGGWSDFVADFDDLAEAVAECEKRTEDHREVIDSETGEEVHWQ